MIPLPHVDPASGHREREYLLPGLGELDPNVPILGVSTLAAMLWGWQHRPPQVPIAEPTPTGLPQTARPPPFSCSLLHRALVPAGHTSPISWRFSSAEDVPGWARNGG